MPLIRCEDCGRSFNENAMEKHERICKKVFIDKRKKFNSAAARLGELENANELINNAKQIEKQVRKVTESRGPASSPKGSANKPMPKWKKESIEFRQQMLAAKAAQGDGEAAVKAAALQKELGANTSVDPDKCACPHCGRTFNKEAAERHINICLKTFGSNKGRLVRGGGTNAAAGGPAVGARGGGVSRQSGGGALAARRSDSIGRAASRQR